MNGGKETGASLGRNKTAQFSLTECLYNYLTQWKRSQNITAKISLKQDVQQRWDMTRCLGTPQRPRYLCPDRSGQWVSRWQTRTEREAKSDCAAGERDVSHSDRKETACRGWGGCLSQTYRKWALGLHAPEKTAS